MVKNEKMKLPQPIKKGDTIALVSPAKHISADYIAAAQSYWEKQGYKVLVGEYANGQHNYFSGTIEERCTDFQAALNNDDVKAIICTRGGYGCLHLVDIINWAGMLNSPKWIVGFSDVTVFHQKLNRLNICSLHATMPLNYAQNTPQSFERMNSQLSGEKNAYAWQTNQFKIGKTEGTLLGGNLSILHSLIGTDDQPDYNGSILFIEEVGEYLYAIDRMFYALSKSGILDKISGLLIGGMTDIKDTVPPFGLTLQEIILNHFPYRNLPIAFEFSAGHIHDNHALILGKHTRFEVNSDGSCTLEQ